MQRQVLKMQLTLRGQTPKHPRSWRRQKLDSYSGNRRLMMLMMIVRIIIININNRMLLLYFFWLVFLFRLVQIPVLNHSAPTVLWLDRDAWTHHAERRRGSFPPGAVEPQLRALRPEDARPVRTIYQMAGWKLHWERDIFRKLRQTVPGIWLRKSFSRSWKALTWPFLQRSAHMLVPSPPLISTW